MDATNPHVKKHYERTSKTAYVHTPHLQKLLRYICERWFEHYVAASFSSVASAVHEATTRYLGWEMYWHRP